MRQPTLCTMSHDRKQIKEQRLAAYEGAVKEYQAPLLRYASRIVCDTNAAQDIVQNAFIKLFKKWEEELEPSPKLSSWLYRVTHNCAVDYLRKETRHKTLHSLFGEEVEHLVQPDLGEAFRISEEAARAVKALHALSIREQQLVILKVYEGKSYREISEISELSASNVGYILHHAMKKMAKELKTT